MKTRLLYFLFVICTISSAGQVTSEIDPYPDTISQSGNDSTLLIKYIEHVISIIQTHSIWRDSIDFNAIRQSCLLNLEKVKSTADCYPLIRCILLKLGDHHSFLLPPTEAKRTIANKSITPAQGKYVSDNIAYISLPSVMGQDTLAVEKFVTDLQNLIKSLDKRSLKGWIVDLRLNSGGNCYPMLAGIGPLIGDGIVGYLIDNNNHKTSLSYKDGASYEGHTVRAWIKGKPYKLIKKKPIAILIGPFTASSGEIVAIAFKGIPHCKFFGLPTAGLTTGNEQFILSDKSILYLTTTIDADRNLNLYGGKIYPDSEISSKNRATYEGSDHFLDAAIDWLKTK